MEKNVSVGVREHERSGEVVPCDEPVTLIIVILCLEELEGLLDVKVRILEEQLTLLLNEHLRVQYLVPQRSVELSRVL